MRIDVSAGGFQGLLFLRLAERNFDIGRVEIVEKDIDDSVNQALRVYAERHQGGDSLASYHVFVGWPKLVVPEPGMIVIHDSLLPRYKGHCPVVTALINGDRQIGVTAFEPSAAPDSGKILAAVPVAVEYPAKVKDVYEALAPCQITVLERAIHEPLQGQTEQRFCESYSMWRDEDDYVIEWGMDAGWIARFIDAVGYPFKGASTADTKGTTYRILDAEPCGDALIGNRTPGKVFSLHDHPVVVCGTGLLRVVHSVPEIKRLKTRLV